MSLHAGQVVRYGDALWRVDYVNDCRARIVPLLKRHILEEGVDYSAEQRGVNVSPNSTLEVVTDIDRVKTEIELAVTERELAEVKAELAKEAKRAALSTPAPKPAPTPKAPRGAGWHLTDLVPDVNPGSLKESVLLFLAAHPGSSTKEVVIEGATPGAVAACLDRFMKAGVVVRNV